MKSMFSNNACVLLRECIFDLCAEQGSPELRCASYEAYAAACQEASIALGAWRQQLDCGMMLNTLRVTQDAS